MSTLDKRSQMKKKAEQAEADLKRKRQAKWDALVAKYDVLYKQEDERKERQLQACVEGQEKRNLFASEAQPEEGDPRAPPAAGAATAIAGVINKLDDGLKHRSELSSHKRTADLAATINKKTKITGTFS
jgi:hypothetical protein